MRPRNVSSPRPVGNSAFGRPPIRDDAPPAKITPGIIETLYVEVPRGGVPHPGLRIGGAERVLRRNGSPARDPGAAPGGPAATREQIGYL